MAKKKQRVRRWIEKHHVQGYVDREERFFQTLQERRWWGWKTISKEEIPHDVMIAKGALGYDVSGWKSKLSN